MEKFITHNQKSWDKQAEEQGAWSTPVSCEQIEQAKQGNWEVHLTPQPLPKEWLGNIKGKKILCLASAGGQQAPILSAAGAEVVVFDLSEKQLDKDRKVAEQNNLSLQAVQGDMRDLSAFANESFDIVFNPISNLYIPDVNEVWKEAHRVLRQGGTLLCSFYNPIVFVGDKAEEYREQGVIKPIHSIPYSEIDEASEEEKARKEKNGEAFVFGHSLSDLIGGQIRAGFSIDGFVEEYQPHPRFVIDHYLPTFLGTKALKK